MDKLVSIIVPAYNEEENIEPLVEAVYNMLKKNKFHYELIIVDDGSEDETYLRAKETSKIHDFVKITRNNRKMGVTNALLTGFKIAEGDIFVYFPADLQYSPEDIPRMINKIQEGFDIVCGWKVGRYGKKFVSDIYNMLSRLLFHIPVHDLNSIKAFKREVISVIPWRKDWHRYIVVMAFEQGFNVGEIKVDIYPRKYGISKFRGPMRVVIGILDLITVKFQLSLMHKPMLYFGIMGGSLLFVGFIIGIIALYLRYGLGRGYRLLLFLVIFLVLSGISLFTLGFLAEAIAGIRDEIHQLKSSKR